MAGEDLPRPQGLVLLSPAIGITRAAVFAVWQARMAELTGMDKLAWTDILPEYDPYKYNSFAVNAGEQMYQLTQDIASRVKQLDPGSGIKGFGNTPAEDGPGCLDECVLVQRGDEVRRGEGLEEGEEPIGAGTAVIPIRFWKIERQVVGQDPVPELGLGAGHDRVGLGEFLDVVQVGGQRVYVLSTGCQWMALPKDLPPKSTAHNYFSLWDWDGTLG